MEGLDTRSKTDTFFHTYVSHLLPALKRLSNGTGTSSNGEWIENVRLEVDMALVSSAGGNYHWCSSLKRTLNERKHSTGFALKEEKAIIEREDSLGNYPSLIAPKRTLIVGSGKKLQKKSGGIRERFSLRLKACWRKLALKPRRKKSRTKRLCRVKRRERKDGSNDLGSVLKGLQSVVPGGNQMGMSELLHEVESYAVYLQMQVNDLSCLVSGSTSERC